MRNILAAVGVSASGILAQAFAPILAVAAPENSAGIAPYVQGGGSAAAVGGLLYVARLIAKGELVPRAVKDAEEELKGQIMVQAQREATAMELAEDVIRINNKRESQHDQVVLLLSDAKRAMEAVSSEMGYWRNLRKQGTRTGDRE